MVESLVSPGKRNDPLLLDAVAFATEFERRLVDVHSIAYDWHFELTRPRPQAWIADGLVLDIPVKLPGGREIACDGGFGFLEGSAHDTRDPDAIARAIGPGAKLLDIVATIGVVCSVVGASFHEQIRGKRTDSVMPAEGFTVFRNVAVGAIIRSDEGRPILFYRWSGRWTTENPSFDLSDRTDRRRALIQLRRQFAC